MGVSPSRHRPGVELADGHGAMRSSSADRLHTKGERQVNPKMLGRLDELEADLLARRQRAETEGWTGEVEGIDLTLTFLRTKRDDTQRRIRGPAARLTIQRLSATSHPREDDR
jgi:hypothetical protein